MKLGCPIVVVTINYRLNILGYLTSREIEAEATAAGETPVRSQGLNDQKLALQWIQKHIGLFGGDARQVTVGGESAGAMSVHYLLHHKPDADVAPLFVRALICSAPTPSLRPAADGQALFDQLVKAAGVRASAPYQTKLAVLRSYTAQQLLAFVPDLPVSTPFVDAAWFAGWDAPAPEAPPCSDYWGRLPAWCPEIIVGTVRDEMALFLARDETLAYTAADVQRYLGAVCPDPAFAAAVWDAPVLQEATTPLGRLVSFATELFMRTPTRQFAASVCRQCPDHRIYYYKLDIVDPFAGTALDGSTGGPLRGFAWHSFGNALLFHQPACHRDAELGLTSDKMTETYLALMHGGGAAVWEPFGVAGRRMNWNGSRSSLVTEGLEPYDPVSDHLRALGRADWVAAYDEFKTDMRRVRILLE